MILHAGGESVHARLHKEPTMPEDPTQQVTRALATALDADEFAAAAALLADDCRYESPRGPLTGPEPIIESYRAASQWAHEVFDRIEYDSTVTLEHPGRAVITYLDRLIVGPRTHEHRCRQIIEVDTAGRITRIEHQDIPGEPEAAETFLTTCGIKRPDPT